MMKYLLLLPCLFISFFIHASEFVEPNDRIINGLNIRAEPHSEAAKIGHMLPGGKLPLLSKDVKYYYEIELPSGQTGYVSKSYSRVITNIPQTQSDLKITFFDVGQGDSTLIKCPNRKHILIDAGSLSGVGSDDIRSQLIPELNSDDFRIHTLIITHPDADHYNKIENVLDDIPIDTVFWVGSKEDYNKTFWEWFDTELTADKRRLKADNFDPPNTPNPTIDCGKADFFILAADVQAKKSKKNATSIVVMVRYKEFEAIFTGDATHATESVILDRYNNKWLDIDLLKVAHHGSLSTSTGQNWANILSPEVAIISAGNRNRHGHPRQEVIERLEPHTKQVEIHPFISATGKRGNYKWHPNDQYDEAIYSTVTNGMIQVTSDGNGWELSTDN